DYTRALECKRKAIELSPAWAGGHAGLGDLLYAMDDMKGAAAAYREAFRLEPKVSYALWRLISALDNNNEADAALAESKRAIGLFPKDEGIIGQYVFDLERDSRRAHEEVDRASRIAALDVAVELCRN